VCQGFPDETEKTVPLFRNEKDRPAVSVPPFLNRIFHKDMD